MTPAIEQSVSFKSTPAELYEFFMDSAKHSANTTGARQPQDLGSPPGLGTRRYGRSRRATSHGPQNQRIKPLTIPMTVK